MKRRLGLFPKHIFADQPCTRPAFNCLLKKGISGLPALHDHVEWGQLCGAGLHLKIPLLFTRQKLLLLTYF